MAKWLGSLNAANDPPLTITQISDQYKMNPVFSYAGFPNIDLDGLSVVEQQIRPAASDWSNPTKSTHQISVSENTFSAVALSNTLTPGNWVVRARLGLRPWSAEIPFTLAAWTPSLLTNLAAWYEPNKGSLKKQDGTTASVVDGDAIGLLPDWSGSGFNLTSLTTSLSDTSAPARQTNGIGKTVGRWDGVNDVLTRTASQLNLYNASGVSVFMALKANAAAGWLFSESSLSTTNTEWGALSNGTTPSSLSMLVRNDAGGGIISANTEIIKTLFDLNPHVLGLVDNGSSITPWLDGAKGTPVAYTRSGVMTAAVFALGALVRFNSTSGTSFGGFDLAQLLIAKSVASDADCGHAAINGGALQGQTL